MYRKECFSPLSPHGKIILFSSETGASHKDNLAQKIANEAKRTVIAPSELIYCEHVSAFHVYQLTLFHRSTNGLLKNAFKVFHPVYQKYKKVFEDKLHQREKEAAEGITKHFKGKSWLPVPASFQESQEHLRFCKDNPRPKLLFFSGLADYKNALDPSDHQELSSLLAEHYTILSTK